MKNKINTKMNNNPAKKTPLIELNCLSVSNMTMANISSEVKKLADISKRTPQNEYGIHEIIANKMHLLVIHHCDLCNKALEESAKARHGEKQITQLNPVQKIIPRIITTGVFI